MLAAFALTALPTGIASAFSIQEGGFADAFPDRPIDRPGGPAVVSLGLNLIMGSSACFGFGCSDLWDSLQIEVPVGLEISLITYEVTDNFNDAFGAHLLIHTYDGMTILDPPNDPNILANPPSQLIRLDTFTVGDPQQSSLVLGPGIYDVVSVNGGNNRYTTQFFALPEGTSVPEPSPALFMIAALASLSVSRAAVHISTPKP